MGESFKREGHMYTSGWFMLIFKVKPTQDRKAIILELKINKLIKK